MAQCMWTDGDKCRVMFELTGEPVECDGWKPACLGRAAQLIDRRDQVAVQLNLGGDMPQGAPQPSHDALDGRPDYRCTLSPKEADLVAMVISSGLTGTMPPLTPEDRAYLVTFKNSLLRRMPGRRPQVAGVQGEPVTRLGE